MGLKPPLKRALLLSVTMFEFMQNTFHFSGRAVTLPAKRWEPWRQHPPVWPKSGPISKGSVLLPWTFGKMSEKASGKAVWTEPWQGVKNGWENVSLQRSKCSLGGREGAGKKVYPSSGGLTTPQAEQGQPQGLVKQSQSAICFRKPATVHKRVLRSYSSTP